MPKITLEKHSVLANLEPKGITNIVEAQTKKAREVLAGEQKPARDAAR
jgi:hypothetical protein